jgi:hypothetical protein
MNRTQALAKTAVLGAFLTAMPFPGLHGAEISATELKEMLARPGPHPVLIDIRSTADFQLGSIPSAINIPGRVLLEKRMKFNNGCVLISDGIADKVDPADLATRFQALIGGKVDFLGGGLAAWSELKDVSTTHAVGAREGRSSRTVTYQDIADRRGGVCLIDLRTAPERVVPAGHKCPVGGLCRQQAFHYCASLEEFHRLHRQRNTPPGEGPLIVLVDGEDGRADAELEKLLVEGHHRAAILLGGAEIIATQGRRGLERRGGASIRFPENGVVAPGLTPIDRSDSEPQPDDSP